MKKVKSSDYTTAAFAILCAIHNNPHSWMAFPFQLQIGKGWEIYGLKILGKKVRVKVVNGYYCLESHRSYHHLFHIVLVNHKVHLILLGKEVVSAKQAH